MREWDEYESQLVQAGEQMAERLAAWADETWSPVRRVTCIESEGPRRTWVLYEGGRQVGLVRLRSASEWVGFGSDMEPYCEWTVEASDRTRQLLGLDDAPESGQTDRHG